MEGKEPGSLKVSGNDGGIAPSIVTVTTVKEGYMAPAVEENSFVTELSITGKARLAKPSTRRSAHPKERFPYRIVAVTVLGW